MKKIHFAALALSTLALMQCADKPKPVIEAPASSETPSSSSAYVEPVKSSEFIPSSSSTPVVDPKAEINALIQEITDPNNTIYFELNSDELTSEGQSIAQKLAELLLKPKAKSIVVKIAGHADERGTEQYNMVLSANRAKTVKKYLTDLGVASGRISTVAFGKMKPAVDGNDESAWSKNRRAAFEAKTKD